MSNFTYDLTRGRQEEEKLCVVLTENGFTNITLNKSEEYEILKSWDVQFTKKGVTYTGELKADYKSEQTGRVAIEYECNGKPSGITTTTSDWWFYKLGDSFYAITPTKIKEFIRNNTCWLPTVKGGDNQNAKLYLIHKDLFITISKLIPNGK